MVCAGIPTGDTPAFPCEILWGERSVRSAANPTRCDGLEFLELAAREPIDTELGGLPRARANAALDQLRRGEFQGTAALLTTESRSGYDCD